MFSEKETKTVASRETLVKEVNQALRDAMQKAVAEQNWERVNTIVYLMQGSNTPR